MVKVLAYIILIAGLSTVAFTQSTFQLIIEKNDSTSPSSPTASITETSNGEIYAMSTIYPFGGYSKIRLIKMNKFGEVLWDTTYKQTSGYEFFPEVIPAHDGGVIVASLSTSYVIDDKDSTWDMLIWKISEEGSIEWQQVLSSFSFTDMYPTEDKGYLFLGRIREEWSNQIDIIVYKTDLYGNLVWKSQLGQPWMYDDISSIKEIKGQIYVSGYQSPGWSIDFDGALHALDTLGSALWTIYVPNSPENDDIRVRTVFKFDSRFFFEASNGLYEFDPMSGEYWEVPDSLNVSTTGTLTQGYNYQVLCGTDQINLLNGWNPFYLQKYDNLLEPFYEKTIPEITGPLVECIFTLDGGVLTLTAGGDYMQITKTDCLGNVDFWSEECDSKIPQGEQLLIYPNPSENEIRIDATFDFNEVAIYSPNGQHISFVNPCSCSRQTINISDLSAGVYVVRISSDENYAISRFVKL